MNESFSKHKDRFKILFSKKLKYNSPHLIFFFVKQQKKCLNEVFFIAGCCNHWRFFCCFLQLVSIIYYLFHIWINDFGCCCCYMIFNVKCIFDLVFRSLINFFFGITNCKLTWYTQMIYISIRKQRHCFNNKRLLYPLRASLITMVSTTFSTRHNNSFQT